MKQITFYVLVLFALINITSCRKKDTTGDLIVNARDGVGTSLIGSTIYLYNNQADFNNKLYSDSKVTDNSGQVKFINLKAGVYYVDCDFVNQLNQAVTIWGSGSVSAGYEKTITITP